jgi:hypothetical protein
VDGSRRRSARDVASGRRRSGPTSKSTSVELAQAGARACEHATQLRLTDADVDALLVSRMAENEAYLARAFKGVGVLPGGRTARVSFARMGGWARSFAHGYPKLCAAAAAGDWETAVLECTISGEDKNAGLIPRNIANRICFANAARVRDNPIALRASEVYWPLELVQRGLA